MFEYVLSFLSRYLYAILFSALVSTSALSMLGLTDKRAYNKRTAILILSLLGSFLIAISTTSICVAHWLTMSYGAIDHIFCTNITLSYLSAICTGWITMMSVFFSLALLCATVNYYFIDKIVFKFYHIKPLNRNQAKVLFRIVANLSQKAGVEVPRVGLMECSTPRIFSVGRSQRSTIVLSIGLLETLSTSEIEASLAHEIAHIKNKDCLIKSLASTFKFAVPFNFLGCLIEPAVSRNREFLADEVGVKMTGRPLALISALVKLYAHFEVSPQNQIPVGSNKKPFFARTGKLGIFNKHPPLAERLERLSHFANCSSFQF